jgi:hypothetical protein
MEWTREMDDAKREKENKWLPLITVKFDIIPTW